MPGGVNLTIDSAAFADLIALIADAYLHKSGIFEVLTNGDQFYEVQLAAIRSSRSFICLEAYIFQKGQIANRFAEALADRAHAGVEVRLVLDAVGSFNSWRSTFRKLIASGGQVRWYNPLRWYNLGRYDSAASAAPH
jgi:cardiolipin synthase